MLGPQRGEVWLADLNPTRGHEQAGRRPIVVVSVALFNEGPAGLVIVLPMTALLQPIPSWVEVRPSAGSVRQPSAIPCEAIRSLSTDRLVERWGSLSPATLAEIEDRLSILLDL